MKLMRWGILVCLFALVACSQSPNADTQQAKSATTSSTEAGASAASDVGGTPGHAVNPGWAAYIAQAPHGRISARTPLVIRFTHDVTDKANVGKPVDDLVRFTPSIGAKAVFTATDKLEIRHKNPLQRGKQLKLTMFAAPLNGVKKKLAPWTQELTVMKQSMDVKVGALAPVKDGSMTLSGRVIIGDVANPDSVAKVVQARQGKQALKVAWHQVSGLVYQFQAEGIRRDDNAASVKLSWNGEPVGVDNHGSHSYRVPSSPDAFVITTVRVKHRPKPHLRVQFSQPLLGTQNLAGLVTLDGHKVKTGIDGGALLVYPENEIKADEGTVELVVHKGIRSDTKVRLRDTYKHEFTLAFSKPGVQFVGKGTILPTSKTLSVPFKAVGAKSVHVQAFEVYPENIPQYLQRHDLNSAGIDRQTGRWLWQKTISIPANKGYGWQRYWLDLTKLMAKHPHGLVILKLRLDSTDSTYLCQGQKNPDFKAHVPNNAEGDGQYSYVAAYYKDAGYVTWSGRHNPCTNSYYVHNARTHATRAFMASNLGLIAKQGENNQLLVFASWLEGDKPAAGVQVTVWNYQHQKIGHGVTDSHGSATLQISGHAYNLVAKKDDQVGYLVVGKNHALPTNQFDTGGIKVQGGLRGYFYSGRDVWRPGDDIHLVFVLHDPEHNLPAHYPLTLEWVNPRGEKVAAYTDSKPVGEFYRFNLHTSEKAPTGNWHAIVHIGNKTFGTHLRVAAVTPNHLKIDVKTPQKSLHAGHDNAMSLHSQWLNGATAVGLKSDVKVRLVNGKTQFSGYSGYAFSDPTRKIGAHSFTAFQGHLNEQGTVDFKMKIPDMTPPGMVRAVLTTRVFEKSGDYSIQVRSFKVNPYQHWVGLQVPEGSGWGGALARNKNHEIGLLTLNNEGQPEAHRALTLSIYRIDWRWWWDKGREDLTNFRADSDTERVKQVSLVSNAHGLAHFELQGKKYRWGRYLIRVCQDQGDDCAASTVYLGWGGNRSIEGKAATRLPLSTDKNRYTVGDTAHVKVPVGSGDRMLVSLENGSRVLSHRWVQVAKGKSSMRLDIPVTAAMAPNAYVDITLLQPHSKRNNDRPIRLYGIVPILVNNPKTLLKPVIKAPNRIRPQHDLPVTVSEQHGQPMTYTLAVVDEGLLGLTNFKTPAIHSNFFRREALGVKTWDLYDDVVGAYGADLSRLLSIGGSSAGKEPEAKQKRRFPPVVRFLGPFKLKAGQAKKHEVDLPAYMGQVRIMVVAGNGKAYGNADQDVTVTQPLTLLSTLPRVLGPKETLDLPVTVFASPDKQGHVPKNVSITGRVQAPLKLLRSTTKLHFNEAGNKIGMLSLQVGNSTGKADVTVDAIAGRYHAREILHMPIRAPNPPGTRALTKGLDKGQQWQTTVKPFGVTGTNSAWITVSRLPSMNLQSRLSWLVHYPHGCIEQTTSSVFPQLYLYRLVTLSDTQKANIQENINAAIKRYRRFQVPSGGFSFWPGGSTANAWGTDYAGHFLLEAKRQGYAVPGDMLDAWKRYQKRQANSLGSHPWDWAVQAYRLYTLALAGSPEVGAMNRLHSLLLSHAEDKSTGNYVTARWMLAAAYQQMGLDNIARQLTPSVIHARYYRHRIDTFGSPLRDQAIAMQVLAAEGQSERAWKLAKVIAEKLASHRWYSTQALSWALMNEAKIGGSRSGAKGFSFQWKDGKNQEWHPVHSQAAIFRKKLEHPEKVHRLWFKNTDNQHLFVHVTTRGTKPPGKEKAIEHGLVLHVRFEDLHGQQVDPSSLPQGTDFEAIITVGNNSGERLQHVALTQVMPSGWQISGAMRSGHANKAGYTYRDIQDDRVLTYFSLSQNDDHGKHKIKIFKVQLNASFAGRFYLPGWKAVAQYKGEVYGRTKGEWVNVKREL